MDTNVGSVKMTLVVDTEKAKKNINKSLGETVSYSSKMIDGISRKIKSTTTKSVEEINGKIYKVSRTIKTVDGVAEEAFNKQRQQTKELIRAEAEREKALQYEQRIRLALSKQEQSENSKLINSNKKVSSSLSSKSINILRKALNKLINTFKKLGRATLNLLKNFVSLIKNGLNKLINAFHNTRKSTNSFTESLKTAIKYAVSFLSLRALYNFGKEALSAGKDLQEAGNVVSLAFGNMKKEVEAAANSAAYNLGMAASEYKKYIGLNGLMAESFGYTEEEAFKMSKNLTDLTANMAALHGITTELSSKRIKAIFTGETEAIKEFGIVMTDAALNEYAQQKGITKTVKAMTTKEKVMLRYLYVMEKANYSQDYFIKKEKTWAGQTQILSSQFTNLKAILGQGLMNALVPVVKVINTLMQKLLELAGLFKNFTARIFGDSTGAISALGVSSDEAADSLTGVGDAGAAAADKIKKSFAGIDEITTLTSQKDSASDATSIDSLFDLNKLKEENGLTEKINTKLNGIQDKILRIKDALKEGWNFGKANTYLNATIEKIKAAANFIGSEFYDALEVVAFNIGRIFGNISGAFSSVISGVMQGISKFLDKNSNAIASISDALGKIFDVLGRIFEKVFNSQVFIDMVAKGIQLWYNALMFVSQWFEDHEQQITNAMIMIADLVGQVFDLLGQIIKLPGFKEFVDTLTNIAYEILTILYDKMKSFLDTMQEKTNDGSINKFFYDLSDKLKELWETLKSPEFNEFVSQLGELAENILKSLWAIVKALIDYIIEHKEEITEFLNKVNEKFEEFLSQSPEQHLGQIKTILALIGAVLGTVTAAVIILNAPLIILGGLLLLIVAAGYEFEKMGGSVQKCIDGWKLAIDAVIDSLKQLKDWFGKSLEGWKMLGDKIEDGLGISEDSWLRKSVPEIIKEKSSSKKDTSYKPKAFATGGYVKANQPQLAIVGDNRTQGEIISPEDKMAEVFASVLSKYFGEGQGGANTNINNIITIDGKTIYSEMKNYSSSENSRQGVRQFR